MTEYTPLDDDDELVFGGLPPIEDLAARDWHDLSEDEKLRVMDAVNAIARELSAIGYRIGIENHFSEYGAMLEFRRGFLEGVAALPKGSRAPLRADTEPRVICRI